MYFVAPIPGDSKFAIVAVIGDEAKPYQVATGETAEEAQKIADNLNLLQGDPTEEDVPEDMAELLEQFRGVGGSAR